MDASSLMAGVNHKICLDLDGLATATHDVIDLEEAIYISPILQLNTTRVKAERQQELSFQCKACHRCNIFLNTQMYTWILQILLFVSGRDANQVFLRGSLFF